MHGLRGRELVLQQVGRHRPAPEPALAVADVQVQQRAGVVGGLHALGHHERAQPGGEVHERADQAVQHPVGGQAVDDAAVELDDVRLGDDDVAQRGEPGPDVVDGQAHAALAQRLDGLPQGRVVLDRVVLGQLEQDPGQGQRGEEVQQVGAQQRGRRHVHRHVAGDAVHEPGRALQRLQLQRVAAADAVGLGEDDVGSLLPVLREAAERLGADPAPGDDVDDGLEHDAGAAGGLEGTEPGLDGVAAGLLAHLGLDDHRRGPGQDVHQALVAVGEPAVGGEAGGAERAVQRAVAEGDGDRDVGADPGELRGGPPHRLGVLAQVAHDRGQVAVEHALAEGQLLLLLVALLEHPRDGGVDDLQGLRRPVHPGHEGDAEVQRLLGGAEEVGDLLLRHAACLGHVVPSARAPGHLTVRRGGCAERGWLAWRA